VRLKPLSTSVFSLGGAWRLSASAEAELIEESLERRCSSRAESRSLRESPSREGFVCLTKAYAKMRLKHLVREYLVALVGAWRLSASAEELELLEDSLERRCRSARVDSRLDERAPV